MVISILIDITSLDSLIQTMIPERPNQPDGAKVNILSILSDVSELESIAAYWSKIAEDNEQKAVDLERSNAELERFAYVASHDLQEPLRMVSSYVELLAKRYDDKLDKDAREFIGYAVDGAKRMRMLINDLLAYSRIGTHGKPFERTDSEVALNKACDNLKRAIEENGAEVDNDPLPTVIADEVQLIQLFQNLLENAIKYRNGKAPQIHVTAQRNGHEWVFSIRDNGIGIDPKFFDRIFVVFQQLHGHTEYSGSGIGLAITKKIVERHGGRIWVESRLGEGSTFYFTIPDIEKGETR